MIHLHLFTEEPSAKNLFDIILPQILPRNVTYSIYSHQGKQDLEKALKTTVPSISKIPGARILITRDQDNNDCKIVKESLNNIIGNSCKSPYLIRIVCHELESWFLGDLNAVSLAYPRFKPEQYSNKEQFRNVDNIQSPNKLLLSIIPEYQYNDVLPKLETSENISKYLDVSCNKSRSFYETVEGIKKLVKEEGILGEGEQIGMFD